MDLHLPRGFYRCLGLGLMWMGAGTLAVEAVETTGALDLRFNGTGVAVTPFLNTDSQANKAVAQRDGKVVVVGEAWQAGVQCFATVRYLPDGSLDNTFGFGGRVLTSISGAANRAYGVALQPDGKIVVVGVCQVGGEDDMAVVRYLPDGNLDTSFSGDGLLTLGFGTGADEARAVVVWGDLIFVAGKTAATPLASSDVAAVRLNADGSLDTSFADDGKLQMDVGSEDAIFDLAFQQQDVKLIMAGHTVQSNQKKFLLVRLTWDGDADPNFGTQGVVTTLAGAEGAEARAMTVDFSEKILVAGQAHIGGGQTRMTVARFLATDGALDPSFGVGGVVTLNPGGDEGVLTGVQAAQNGKILLGGTCKPGAVRQAALMRLDAQGVLDPTFGSSAPGYTFTSAGAGDTLGLGLVRQRKEPGPVFPEEPDPAGQRAYRCTIVGYSMSGSRRDFTVLRYLEGPPIMAVLDEGSSTPLFNGSMIPIGGVAPGGSRSRVITLENRGGTVMNVQASVVHGIGFTVGALGTESIPPSGSTTFTITFTPAGSAPGPQSAVMRITGNVDDFLTMPTGSVYSATVDTDGDGLNDVTEAKLRDLGFDPEVAQASLVATLFGNLQEAQPNLNAVGYYTLPQVPALNLTPPLLHRDPQTGEYRLTIRLEKSTTLTDFQPFPLSAPGAVLNAAGELDVKFTDPGEAGFFRLLAE